MKLKAVAAIANLLLLTAGALAGTEKVVYTFGTGTDGEGPFDAGVLARDAQGTLYGTTEYGGDCGYGTVFQLSISGRETVRHSFCISDGTYPTGSLTLDSLGNIYGTTGGGGDGNCGRVFSLTGTTLKTLHSFTCGTDGGLPAVGVVRDKSGNIYGTASYGGNPNCPPGGTCGVVYKISTSGKFSVIYTFCSSSGRVDGKSAYGGLVIDKNGKLYGTTTLGGDNNSGTVYTLAKSGNKWTETVLHSFAGGPNDGAGPLYGSLTLGTQKIGAKKKAVIFGVTSGGGAQGAGTAFEMIKAKAGYTLKVLHSFAYGGNDGAFPYGTLTKFNSRLYGTTYEGISGGYGTVFELTRKNNIWKETILYSFAGGADGGHLFSGVVADSSGNLYGAAYQGGIGAGVVYEVKP